MLAAARARLAKRAAADGPAGGPPLDRWRRFLRDALTFARLLRRKISTDGVTQRAAALAFVTVLALIPLLAAFTFVAAQLLNDYQDRILRFLTSVLPYSEAKVLEALQNF